MITKYGYDVFFSVSAICLVALVLSIIFIEPRFLKFTTVILVIVFWGLTVNFFRDPDRTTPTGNGLIIAPADGTIIQIKEVAECEHFNEPAILISIFMSPLNVHVNRNPISGEVTYLRYVQGEYFAAFEDKASEKNEQMIVGMKGEKGWVLFKQIAGFVARRIVCTLKNGDIVRAGERFGMIKFGSRVDVYVPKSSVILVKVNEVTAAGETVLARFQ
ncbi:MAG: phosphatidylserine decarboxylase family protein [bacterium]